MEKKNDYENRRFWFYCRLCKKHERDTLEFEFVKLQTKNRAALRCCTCGLLISRNIKKLDKQLKGEGK
ncbi:hypothetical protein ES703_36690 [subsurface metagenome]